MEQNPLLTKVPDSAISFIVVLGLVSLLLSSCSSKQGSNNASAESTPVTPTYPVFKVISQTATLQTNYPATLQGQQNIEIRPKIDGYVEKIYIDEGEEVKKG